jgi:hypothetical protein
MASSHLPSARTFITSIINSLATHAPTTTLLGQERSQRPQAASQNPLKHAPPQLKSIFLTLHVLFPNELLPALDVLDRNLVTHLRVKDGDAEVYLVRSAQQPTYHRREDPGSTCYEVRLKAWNCSCPAFAFSAFPSEEGEQDENGGLATAREEGGEGAWRFGGLSLESQMGAVPVCKHLLACVLVERCPELFVGGVEVREVSKEEFAGWCAGWGG